MHPVCSLDMILVVNLFVTDNSLNFYLDKQISRNLLRKNANRRLRQAVLPRVHDGQICVTYIYVKPYKVYNSLNIIK